MTSNAGCWMLRLAALAIAASLLSGCATAGSDGNWQGACPPVVEYSQAEQLRVADELAVLTDVDAIVEWLADYAVLREQARACAR